MEFCLAFEEVLIKMLDKGDVPTHYILRELNGTEYDGYLNAVEAITKRDVKGEAVGVVKFDGLQTLLLKRCLYHATVSDGQYTVGELVPTKIIQAWPVRVQQALFDKARELSKIRDKPEEVKADEAEAKND
jgi:hypothetical protein